MSKTRTVRLNKQVTARVEQVAAEQGVDPEQWVNDQLARDLFLAKLDEVQRSGFGHGSASPTPTSSLGSSPISLKPQRIRRTSLRSSLRSLR